MPQKINYLLNKCIVDFCSHVLLPYFIREANQFSEEMGKDTEFAVTLQVRITDIL